MTQHEHDRRALRGRAASDRPAPDLDEVAERRAHVGEGQIDAARARDPADEQTGTPSRLNENAGDAPEETRGTKGEQGRAFRGE